MIVSQSLQRINEILENVQAANQRIYQSFKIESNRAIRFNPKYVATQGLENMSMKLNKSTKTSKDTTLTQSNNAATNQQKFQKLQSSSKVRPPQQRIDTINEIVEDTMGQDQSYEQINPFRNFISPNNWMITNSRDQHKSPLETQHEPQCASFRHIEEDNSF